MTCDIHLITLFSRHENLERLKNIYRDRGIVWHLVQFQNEKIVDADEPWIKNFIIPYDRKSGLMLDANNYFILNAQIKDDDYYVFAPDDDIFGPGVFEKIKTLSDDVVIVSMKRGDNIPHDGTAPHGTETLIACPENTRVNCIGGEQFFVKGDKFKRHLYNETFYGADGQMAETLKANYQIRYEPDLFCFFNYLQPGRWATQIY